MNKRREKKRAGREIKRRFSRQKVGAMNFREGLIREASASLKSGVDENVIYKYIVDTHKIAPENALDVISVAKNRMLTFKEKIANLRKKSHGKKQDSDLLRQEPEVETQEDRVRHQVPQVTSTQEVSGGAEQGEQETGNVR